MKKTLQMIVRILVGGTIGFFVMYWIMNSPLEGLAFSHYSFIVNGLLLVILVGLLLFSLIRYRQIQRLLNQSLTGDAEDVADQQMYRWFSDGTLSLNLTLPISLALVSVNLVLDQQLPLVVIGTTLIVVGLVGSIHFQTLVQQMYPERNLPDVSETDYGMKLLAASDDGEKHIMLEGLYKTHSVVNMMLIVGIILLLFYSLLTSTSQLFSIFVITLILIVSNTKYYFSIRNR
ncbi:MULTISPECIES: DUF3169 family protein [unclassified Exiguobacterium]|uniref:DUF3169 family protein n=1 Tax=unclassified Exiguobacterium TaxID=2644629 RepID=UPI000B597CB6|nr:DUF3169 family protein [Exiguobacterium sp. N4-1P]ASI35366.1 hypothetical protein A0126_07245 [Exiguobacterium sp. N4-1P]ASI37379.1 hypothetical protein A0126_17520 [Exiguobacterium sp. N4-1P]